MSLCSSTDIWVSFHLLVKLFPSFLLASISHHAIRIVIVTTRVTAPVSSSSSSSSSPPCRAVSAEESSGERSMTFLLLHVLPVEVVRIPLEEDWVEELRRDFALVHTPVQTVRGPRDDRLPHMLRAGIQVQALHEGASLVVLSSNLIQSGVHYVPLPQRRRSLPLLQLVTPVNTFQPIQD